jgi:hypothetical protein
MSLVPLTHGTRNMIQRQELVVPSENLCLQFFFCSYVPPYLHNLRGIALLILQGDMLLF